MGWTGWQPGMSGLPVQRAKKELKRRFSYGKNLDESEFFDWELQRVLTQYQRAKNGSGYRPPLRTDGILDWASQVALGLVVPAKPKLRGTLFTVAGTAANMWQGYPADVGRAVEDTWFFQPVNYPAAAFPMANSVQSGRAELKRLIRERPGKIALAGYSQGAIVTSLTWLKDIANPKGELHDRLGDVVASVTFGNPCREQGKANGNKLAGIPIPEGRGISDTLMSDTPDWWLDFAHGGNAPQGRDIYTDVPDDDTGEHMTSIFKLVQNVSGFFGYNGLLEQLTEASTNPLVELPALLRAVYFGGAFITARPFATYPHCNYDIGPAIKFLKTIQ
jgi:hypothetical protein